MAVAIKAIGDIIQGIDFEKKPALTNQISKPLGLVLIVANTSNPIAQVCLPMAAAIAAGNVVMVHVPKSLSTYGSLLTKLFMQHLDPDAYRVAINETELYNFSYDAVVIHDDSAALRKAALKLAATETTPRLITSRAGQNFVIVEKEVKNAVQVARLILRAVYTANGQAASSPAIVFVHERVKESLVESLTSQTSTIRTSMNGYAKNLPLEFIEVSEESDLISSTQSIRIVPFTSSERVIDIANEIQAGPVAYIFGNLLQVQYYANEIETIRAVYRNDIPLEALVLMVPDEGNKWSPDLFTRSCHIVSPSRNVLSSLFPPYTRAHFSTLKALWQTRVPLLLKRRNAYAGNIVTRNFFLQGLLITIVPTFLTILGVTGWGAIKLIMYTYSCIRS